MNWIRHLNALEGLARDDVGGKAANLALLVQNGFPVPKGFAIHRSAFDGFLTHNGMEDVTFELLSQLPEAGIQPISEALRGLLLAGSLMPRLSTELRSALEELGAECVAVRSSSLDEDSGVSSLAGLHETYLDVRTTTPEVAEKIRHCWVSLFSERALSFRLRKGLGVPKGMGVVIQRMVQADFSGVALTADPDSGNGDVIVLEWVRGRGESLVSGRSTPALLVVSKEDGSILRSREGRAGRRNGRASIGSALDRNKSTEATMTQYHLLTLKELLVRVERLFGQAQDVEWCYAGGKPWLLQSRPLVGLEVRNGK